MTYKFDFITHIFIVMTYIFLSVTYKFCLCNIYILTLQHINFVFATYRFCLCNIYILSLQHLHFVFATYTICLCSKKYMSMYRVFVFATHKSLFSIHTMSTKNRILYVRISLQNVKFRDFGHFWGRRGSPRAHTLGK